MKNAETNNNSRYLAAQTIARWFKSGEFTNRMLASIGKDRAFITEMVYGVVRWKRFLEWIIRQSVKHKPSPTLQALLMTGLYQVFMMDNVADYAAVNETVQATKEKLSFKEANFINAMLRRTISNRQQIKEKSNQQPLGIKYSHPDILINRWTNNFGAAETKRLCAWNNTRPDIVIRLNKLKDEKRFGALLSELKKQSGLKSFPKYGDFFTLPRGIRIEDLPGYEEGLFLVVDPFVQNAVDLLNPRPGEKVLDACAAPGGKTFLIAEKMRCTGRLLAVDAEEKRITIMRHNLRRLQIENFVEVKQGDLLKQNTFGNEKFDRILADVPCSNTGVIRRKPDVRWRFNSKNLNMLVETQKKMLNQLSKLLKSGGTIVYSTCSLEPEENELLVTAWLKANPDYYLSGEKRSFPPQRGTDGGYAAAIVKR